MKKVKTSLCLLALGILFVLSGRSSITVKAQHEFNITEITQNSISFDWTKVAREWLNEDYARNNNAKFRDFKITVKEFNKNGERTFTKIAPYNKYNYTLSGLKSGTKYRIDVSLYLDYNGGKAGGRTWGIWDQAYTVGTNTYSVKVLQRTKTSLKVDIADAVNSMKAKATAEGGTSFHVSGITLASAEQKGTAADGIRQARKQVVKTGVTYNKRETSKEFTGLKQNTAYAFSALVEYGYTDKNKKYVTVQEYVEAGDIKTASDSDNSGNGGSNNGENGSSSENSENQKEPVVDNNSASGADTKEAATAEDPNKAHISVNKDTLKASRLKKKDQSVTIKISNSKGKVTVKNVSSKKLRKYVSFKTKKGKVIVTLKKGAPKGTYKFKVTTGASGKIKKTTETVKIVVK